MPLAQQFSIQMKNVFSAGAEYGPGSIPTYCKRKPIYFHLICCNMQTKKNGKAPILFNTKTTAYFFIRIKEREKKTANAGCRECGVSKIF